MRSVGRTHDVITKPKIFAQMGLPKSLSYGAPRARSSAIKSIYMYSLDMLTNVERREREKKKNEKWGRLSKVQRERERQIAS